MNGYHILATRDILGPAPREPIYPRLRRALPALAGGAAGIALGSAHPVLGALLGAAVIKNAVDVASGETTSSEAARTLGKHVIATGCSLAAPIAPMVGYGAGVLLGNAVFGTTWEPAPSLDDVRSGKAYISKGQKGSSVEYIQKFLGIPVDGEFGPVTEAAVKKFQSDQGQTVYGYVGANTLIDLEKSLTQDRGNVIPLVASSASKKSTTSSSSSSSSTASAPRSSAPRGSSQDAPAFQTEDTGFLATLKRPLWNGSSLTLWQGGLLGLGVAGILGAGLSFLLPSHHVQAVTP